MQFPNDLMVVDVCETTNCFSVLEEDFFFLIV